MSGVYAAFGGFRVRRGGVGLFFPGAFLPFVLMPVVGERWCVS